jgi:hypothetical protein
MDDHKQEIEKLAKKCLHLEACQIFQLIGFRILYSTVREHLLSSGVSGSDFDNRYHQNLKHHTEQFLASLADDQPALATALREILKEQLDTKP